MIYFYYTDRFMGYNLSPDHPLKPARLMLTHALMSEAGLLDEDDVRVIEPYQASERDLLQIHDKAYIDAVKAEKPDLSFGLGDVDTPVFPGMYDASRLIAGSSMEAAESLIRSDCRAMNIAGGLHHAFPSRAGGFCIFNDPALAIVRLKDKFRRIIYIDIDGHHGDGVQEIFYQDPDVLTVSMHESGKYLFPGTGFIEEVGRGPGKGYSVNIPMPQYSGDDAYIHAFEEIIPSLFNWFRPKAVVAQIGIDTHYSDPLTSLRLTLGGYCSLIQRICELADRYSEGRLLALGGGGYSLSVVPLAWAMAFQIMRGKEMPPLPCRFVELFENVTGLEPLSLPDAGPVMRPGSRKMIMAELDETLSGLKAVLNSIHGIF